jgi:hypothetical protein
MRSLLPELPKQLTGFYNFAGEPQQSRAVSLDEPIVLPDERSVSLDQRTVALD